MEEKPEAGSQRNKARSKQRFLDAVGEIMNTVGFSGLKVNDIARVAGLDKKLMYNYFGGRDELIDEYIRTKDFWTNVKGDSENPLPKDGGREFSKSMLLSQFEYVFKNEEMQKILLWGLLEDRNELKKLAQAREDSGALIFEAITDPHFGDQAKRYRAVTALMVAGIYYLDIYASTQTATFCGLDLKSNEGRNEIEEAITFLIDKTYDDR